MSKGLEALATIKYRLRIVDCDEYGIFFDNGYENEEELSTIEKSLKALEIIATNLTMEAVMALASCCSQEEQVLLKEVLTDENN